MNDFENDEVKEYIKKQIEERINEYSFAKLCGEKYRVAIQKYIDNKFEELEAKLKSTILDLYVNEKNGKN